MGNLPKWLQDIQDEQQHYSKKPQKYYDELTKQDNERRSQETEQVRQADYHRQYKELADFRNNELNNPKLPMLKPQIPQQDFNEAERNNILYRQTKEVEDFKKQELKDIEARKTRYSHNKLPQIEAENTKTDYYNSLIEGNKNAIKDLDSKNKVKPTMNENEKYREALINGDKNYIKNLDSKNVKEIPTVSKNEKEKYRNLLLEGKYADIRQSHDGVEKLNFVDDATDIGKSLLVGANQMGGGVYKLVDLLYTGGAKFTDLITPDSFYDIEKDKPYQFTHKKLQNIMSNIEKGNNNLRQSYANDKSAAKKVLTTAGEAIPAIVTTMFTGAGLAEKATQAAPLMQSLLKTERIAQVIRMTPFTLHAGAGYSREAELDGATYTQQVLYGIAGGLAEGVTEAPIMTKWIDMFGKKTMQSMMHKGGKELAKNLGKVGIEWLTNVAGETLQEAAVEPMTGYAKKAIYQPDKPNFGDGGVIDPKAIKEAGFGGMSMAIVLGAFGLPSTYASHRMATKFAKDGTQMTPEDFKALETQFNKDIQGLNKNDITTIEAEAPAYLKLLDNSEEDYQEQNSMMANGDFDNAQILADTANKLETIPQENPIMEEIKQKVIQKHREAAQSVLATVETQDNTVTTEPTEQTNSDSNIISPVEENFSQGTNNRSLDNDLIDTADYSNNHLTEGNEILFKHDSDLDGGKIVKNNKDGTFEIEVDKGHHKEYVLVQKNGEEFETVTSQPTTKEDISMQDRDFKNVGSKNVKAYQYLHPEVKHHIQKEAEIILGELENSFKGQRSSNVTKNGDVVNTSNQRFTSDTIKFLLDEGYKYKDIEISLNNLITDNGAENKALSKRIEILIDERLSKGYSDFYTGNEMSVNNEYINLKNQIENTEATTETTKEVTTETKDTTDKSQAEQNKLPLLKKETETPNFTHKTGDKFRNDKKKVTVEIVNTFHNVVDNKDYVEYSRTYDDGTTGKNKVEQSGFEDILKINKYIKVAEPKTDKLPVLGEPKTVTEEVKPENSTSKNTKFNQYEDVIQSITNDVEKTERVISMLNRNANDGWKGHLMKERVVKQWIYKGTNNYDMTEKIFQAILGEDVKSAEELNKEKNDKKTPVSDGEIINTIKARVKIDKSVINAVKNSDKQNALITIKNSIAAKVTETLGEYVSDAEVSFNPKVFDDYSIKDGLIVTNMAEKIYNEIKEKEVSKEVKEPENYKLNDNPAEISQMQFYHGTGTEGMKPTDLDFTATNIEGLFGSGIYLTDNLDIAQGYAKARSKKTKTPAVYSVNVKVDKVLNLEKPLPQDAYEVFEKLATQLDKNFEADIVSNLKNLQSKGATGKEIYKEFQEGITEVSSGNDIPKSEFVEYLFDLNSWLKELGYDAYTHVGGTKTNNKPHQVLIMLDPNDLISQTGRTGQITKFEKLNEEGGMNNVTNTEKSEPKPASNDGGRNGLEQNRDTDKGNVKTSESEIPKSTAGTTEVIKNTSENAKPSNRQDDNNTGTDGKGATSTTGNDIHGDSELENTDKSDGGGNDNERTDGGIETPLNYKIEGISTSKTFNPQKQYKANVKAIKLLLKIEKEDRIATQKEQEILAQYKGWGGIPYAFNQYGKDEYVADVKELKALLTTEEYNAAKSTVQDAFYTSPQIVQSMYEALAQFGFKKGTILDPSMGTGNFFGNLTGSMAKSRLVGVELDSITGRIAKQLYPNADVRIKGFQETVLPDNFFDVVISNVPFGQSTVNDKLYNKLKLKVHDYFFIKSLDKVKPGGIIAFVTSKGTLDDVNVSARRLMSQKADFLGAIRLPNTSFKGYAGTSVTSDIIFLRKKDGTNFAGENFINVGKTKDGITINEYYEKNPKMMLGEMIASSNQYGNKSYELKPNSKPLNEALKQAIEKLPKNIIKVEHNGTKRPTIEQIVPTDENMLDGSYGIVDGKLYQRSGNTMQPIKSNSEIITSFVNLKNAVKETLRTQRENASEKEILNAITNLNKVYDKFVKDHGSVNSKEAKKLFKLDQTYDLIRSFEVVSGGKVGKADIFSNRIIENQKDITHADTSDEALMISLNQVGEINFDYMAKLTGKPIETIKEDLKGIIYKNPQGDYETNDEYLSGNVREKLRQAELAAQIDKQYLENVEALKVIQPETIKAADIKVRLGATWIPKHYFKDFICEKLNIYGRDKDRFSLIYDSSTGTWTVDDSGILIPYSSNYSQWGTKRMSAIKIFEKSLNLSQATVHFKASKGEKQVIDKSETLIAREKQDKLKEDFNEWLFNDPTRRNELVEMYNEKYNNTRLRKYDGSHLTFPGMNALVSLKQHQKDAVARIVYGGNTLLAHCVGSGKSYIMQTAGMELKRLGIAKKPMYVIPAHMVDSGQFANEFLRLYPNAKILACTSKDMAAANRKKLFAKITTGNWDAVVISHDALLHIPVDGNTKADFLNEQLKEIEDAILEAAEDKQDNKIVKQLEKTKRNIEAKLEKLLEVDKDNVTTFEEMGVDHIFLDESHNFKNLYLYTKMRNISGIQANEIQKTTDLFMKIKYLQKINNGRGVVFASGTPVSNSMSELYTLQRYMQPQLLKQYGINSFDSWAATFGEVISAFESAPTGEGYRNKERFAKFFNIPELMTMFRGFADIQTQEMLNLPKPKLEGGKPIVVESERSDFAAEYIADLVKRAAECGTGKREKGDDNLLVITNEGRLLALDPRLIDHTIPDSDDFKVNKCADNVYKVWKESEKHKGVQLVFCDIGLPGVDKNKVEKPFNVYDALKQRLIDSGIPSKEIAFIHEGDTPEKRSLLIEKVRQGSVRVLVGSTTKMGEGMNAQDRLIATHELDVPWRPSDIDQREGRMLRQGNMFYDLDIPVKLFRYVTKKTFDTYSWQTIETKAKFINQIMSGDSSIREMEDLSGSALSAAEMKAIASDNPLIFEKLQVDADVYKLKILQSNFNKSKFEFQDSILKLTKRIKEYETYLKSLAKDIKTRNDNKTEKFTMKLAGTNFIDRKEAGDKILELSAGIKLGEVRKIGTYNGFKLELFRKISDNTLKLVDGEHTISLRIVAENPRNIELSDSNIGNITKIDNRLNNMDKEVIHYNDYIERTGKEIESYRSQLNKKFEKEEEIQKLVARQTEINNQLDLSKNQSISDGSVDEGDEESSTPNQYQGHTSNLEAKQSGPNPNLLSFNKKRSNKDVQAENSERFVSSNEEVESRVKSSNGLSKKSLLSKIKEGIIEFKNMSTRTFRNIDPNNPLNAEFIREMVQYPKLKNLSADETVRILDDITYNLDDVAYHNFSRKILLNDLMEEVKAGHSLPLGFTKEIIEKDLEAINNEKYLTKEVKEALSKRNKYWNTVKNDYIEAMQELGIDVSEKFTRENYFRHQVLDYMEAKKVLGTGNKMKVATNRGFSKARHGYEGDINTNYLQAEYEVMAQMIHDKDVAELINRVRSNYDMSETLKQEAKTLREEAKAAGNETKIKWQDLVPEGYTLWQPREGNVFYFADSLPSKITDELMNGLVDEIGVKREAFKKILAQGGKYKEYALPTEIADKLNELYKNEDKNIVSRLSKKILGSWKQWVLTVNPLTVVKYNIRNITGDIDASMLEPGILRFSSRASRELYSAMKNGTFTKDLIEWRDRGGFEDLTIPQEIASIGKLEQFKRFDNKKSLPNPLKAYTNATSGVTNYRESILRYAAYLHYKQALKDGKVKYGASNPALVKGLKSTEDKAYKLSKDLLGAYDEISETGQMLRDHWIPFYSWIEVNFKRYTQSFKNAANKDIALEQLISKNKNTKGYNIAMQISKNLGTTSLRTIALTAALALWNYLKHDDDEDKLPKSARETPHIILGTDKDGKIVYFNRLGAFSDYLDWFGLDNISQDVSDIQKGRKTIKEQLVGTAMSPVNKFANGITPFLKVPVELITGKKAYPEMFNPSTIRNKPQHLAQSLGLGVEYNRLMGIPMQGGLDDDLQNAVVYKSDPQAAAYNNVLDIKRNFEKQRGKEPTSNYATTPKSNALYYYKLALKYNDNKNADKWIKKYIEYGGDEKSLDKSMDMLNPLYGYVATDYENLHPQYKNVAPKIEEKKKVYDEFMSSLTTKEKEQLDLAMKYYEGLINASKKKLPMLTPSTSKSKSPRY